MGSKFCTPTRISSLKLWFAIALDFIIPRVCVVCGRELGMNEEHLCLYCQADLPLTRNWEQKHNPMADQFNALLEKMRPAPLEEPPEEPVMEEPKPEPYAYAASLIYYRGDSPFSRIPQALKYGGNLNAGRYFAHLLGKKMAEQAHWQDVDLVIPVPLHWKRRRSRGYNQAEVIASALAHELGAQLRTDVLMRARRTRSQTSLSSEERLKNVSGVFKLKRKSPELRTKHILLVDDTFTTGATLAACHQVLRNVIGRDVRISVATLAMVSS